MLKISNLNFSYNSNECVYKNFNMSFAAVGVNVILGHNGAGKTTLLKLISGELQRSTGKFQFDHRIVNNAEDIFYLPEYYGCYQQLTVKQNFEFFSGISKTNIDIEAILNQFKLNNKVNSKVVDLSQGQTKRVALANSVLIGAKFILLDEPTNGIDPETKDILIKTIKELAAQKRYFIISTHDLEFASEIADFIHILNNGSIVWDNKLNGTDSKDLKSIYLQYTDEEIKND